MNKNVCRLVYAVVLSLGALASPLVLRAQGSIPLQNAPIASNADTQGLEVQIVEVGRGVAMPQAITRSAGRFILLVVNRSGIPKDSFVLSPATSGTGQNSTLPVATQVSPTLRPHGSGVVNLTAGDYDLKSVTTGKILCKLQIN